MTKTIFALALALLALPAFASDNAVERVRIPGLGTIPYQVVFDARSEAGESLDAFAARIAPQLVAYSDETGFEACGLFARDEAGFGVRIGSNHSHVACASSPVLVISGMTPMTETIHSHGNGAAKLNTTDMKFMGIELNARSRQMFGTLYGQNREAFSETDLSGHAGYLATPTGILHHNGDRQVRNAQGG